MNIKEKEKVLISIGKVAELFGVSTQTIRNWSKAGYFSEQRTVGNHRRFFLEEIEQRLGKEQEEKKKTIIYSRVSSSDQKEDLQRQSEELQEYCQREGITEVETIEDIGSGVNYNKRGLRKLVWEILSGKVKRLVISYKDRLLRFGNELIEQLCQVFDVEIVILHQKEEKDFERSLVEDVLAILIVYSSKVYGRGSHQKRKQAAQKAS